ncbi:MAG: ZIP family metal transporter [Coriobacteriales bacterium]|jgi:ZIP family zinc transporter
MDAIAGAAQGTAFTFLMTAAGSAVVFLVRNRTGGTFKRLCLGFAGGVMIAAAVWSLLIPAIDQASAQGGIGWAPAAGGLVIGVAFMLLLDVLIPHMHPATRTIEGHRSSLKRTTLLVSAVTLHNVPEGMAVGLAFAMVAQGTGQVGAAVALAVGIGIQNFPEGAAISLPLRQEGLSAPRAFAGGVLSGLPEPVFGILAAVIAGTLAPLMPWLLSFAAGAMLYVVVEELIPEAHLGDHSNLGTIGVLAGFLVMMVLDVALG